MSTDRRGDMGDQAMKIHAFIFAFVGLVGAATLAQAQPASGDPLSDAQGAFGTIVGDAFHRPDPVIATASAPGSATSTLGFALRSSLEAPGAVFADVMKPFADADQPDAPAPAPMPQHRHRVHHRHVASRN